MTEFSLAEGLFVSTTPAGAYYAVSYPGHEDYRRLLRSLLMRDVTPALSLDALKEWVADHDEHKVVSLLQRAQGLGWVEGLEQPEQAPVGALEDILPGLLRPLSRSGKALLADGEGFYVSAQGFPHEAAEELSALSADLASLDSRHRRLLTNNLRLTTAAWALVDAAGNSQIGFWPLHIGASRFVLVLAGDPRLNQPALTRLIWALSVRYGA
jgi:hypothetical protein